jgi:fermentation-respiration switch protein FrsA (DUF1100 family)
MSVATAVFTSDTPPATLKSLVPKVQGALFLVYGENGQVTEKPANTMLYAAAHEPKELWEVPGSKHMGGIDARPADYERRVVGFFDRHLPAVG